MRFFYFLLFVLLSHDINYCEGSGLLRAPNNQEKALPNEQGDREVSVTSPSFEESDAFSVVTHV
jgi:hypothetical protein